MKRNEIFFPKPSKQKRQTAEQFKIDDPAKISANNKTIFFSRIIMHQNKNEKLETKNVILC